MKQTFTRILILTMLSVGQGFSQEEKPVQESQEHYENGNGFENNENRLPQLLRDIKVLLSDALIADVMEDTLEVVYTLNRIFDLLTEADQYGEKNDEDKDEFNRFEESLVELYIHRFNTLDKEDAAITAEQLRMDVTTFTEPLEVEMGASQFTVVEDRDGHIPLIRNKKVDQTIKYFQTKGRRQFEIWLDRLNVYGPMISQILDECNLPPELIYLAMIESGLNPKAYSKAAANGMWQFIYSTGKMYGLERNWYVDERRDPEKATRAACAYLTKACTKTCRN
jgi:membrane-bound lytic murein transglycosylase D